MTSFSIDPTKNPRKYYREFRESLKTEIQEYINSREHLTFFQKRTFNLKLTAERVIVAKRIQSYLADKKFSSVQRKSSIHKVGNAFIKIHECLEKAHEANTQLTEKYLPGHFGLLDRILNKNIDKAESSIDESKKQYYQGDMWTTVKEDVWSLFGK